MKTLVFVLILKKQDHAYAHIIRNYSFKNNTEASNLDAKHESQFVIA